MMKPLVNIVLPAITLTFVYLGIHSLVDNHFLSSTYFITWMAALYAGSVYHKRGE